MLFKTINQAPITIGGPIAAQPPHAAVGVPLDQQVNGTTNPPPTGMPVMNPPATSPFIGR